MAEMDICFGRSASLQEMTDRVLDVCASVEADGTVRPLLIDLMADDTPAPWLERTTLQEVTRWEKAVRRLELLPALTIAVSSGRCTGAAFDILLATDYRIVSDDFELVAPCRNDLTWPGMSLYRLSAQLGGAAARRLVLWNEAIGADLALRLGLVDEVGEPGPIADARVARFSGGAKDVAIRKRLLLEAGGGSFELALGAHLAACDRELRRVAVG